MWQVVSTSVDGRSFSASVAVMSCHDPGRQCGGRIEGKSKNPGPSYPQAVTVTEPERMAGLYVVATMNKEDVVVVRVPFAALDFGASEAEAAAALNANPAAAAGGHDVALKHDGVSL